MLSDVFHGHISVQEASWIDVDGPASIFYSGHFESLSLASSIKNIYHEMYLVLLSTGNCMLIGQRKIFIRHTSVIWAVKSYLNNWKRTLCS